MAKKKSRAKAPASRDLAAEMAMAMQYASQFAAAQVEAQVKANQKMIDQALEATDKIAGNLDNAYTAKGRSALDSAMGQVGQLDGLGARLSGVAAQAEGDIGGTEIERMLQAQATEDLALGGALSGEEERMAAQQARAGAASRGLGVSVGSLAAEILNRNAFSTARQDARRSFAGNVNQMITSNRLNRLGTAGNLIGQTAGLRQNAAQLGMQGAQGYIALDPYQRALGSNIPIASQGPSASMISNAFGNVLAYAQDLNNTNFNANWANYISGQNNAAALRGARGMPGAGNGALYGAIGTAAGTVLGGVAGAAAGGAGAVVGAGLGASLGGAGGAMFR